MRCDAMRCDVVRCGAMRRGAVRCDAMRCGAVRCGAMRRGAVRCGLFLQMWLCLPCGEKYKSRNYCPTCGVTYVEDDNTVQAVGCSACEFWVHAKCEGLSTVRVA